MKKTLVDTQDITALKGMPFDQIPLEMRAKVFGFELLVKPGVSLTRKLLTLEA